VFLVVLYVVSDLFVIVSGCLFFIVSDLFGSVHGRPFMLCLTCSL